MAIPDEFRDDPVLGPLVRDLDAATGRISAHEQRMAAYEAARLIDGFRGQLAALKQADPDLDPDELVRFAVSTGTPNLRVAHRAFQAERVAERARQEAEARGFEKGQRLARQARNRPPLLRKPAGVESLQDLKEEDVLADPEIRAAMWPDE